MKKLLVLFALLASASLSADQFIKCCVISTEASLEFTDNTGGFLVERTDTDVRDQDTTDPATYIPATRTAFTFPSPYLTRAIRMTIGTEGVGDDCEGSAANFGCVRQTGYSDWGNIFNQGLATGSGYANVCVWNDFYDLGVRKACYNISTGVHSGWQYIFAPGDELRTPGSATDSWQTSMNAAEPDVLYVRGGGSTNRAKYLRCDTGDGVASLPISSTDGLDCVVVGDINSLAARTAMASVLGGAAADYLNDVRIWSPHVSGDGTKFSASILDFSGSALGTIYMTAADTWVVKPGPAGDPFIDLSGTYGAYASDQGEIACPGGGNDFTVFLLASPATDGHLCDEPGGTYPQGAPGHLAFGYGYMLASDNSADSAGGAGFEQVKLWPLAAIVDRTAVTATGVLVTSYPSSFPNGFGQPAWGTAVAAGTTAIANQQVCHTNVASGGAPNPAVPRERELYCYRPGDDTHLMIAPQMTDMDSTGTGGGEPENAYYKGPKPNISTDGRWYYPCTNHWTAYMDCFLIRIPRAVLPAPGPPPALDIFRAFWNRLTQWL